jgi:hypothetical protein
MSKLGNHSIDMELNIDLKVQEYLTIYYNIQ